MSYAGPASEANKRPLEIDSATARTGPSGPSGVLKPITRSPKFSGTGARGRTAAFSAGIVLGALLGAGIALLVAPQTGADTRRALVRKGRRLRIRGRDVWDDLRVELRRAARRRRRRAAGDPAT